MEGQDLTVQPIFTEDEAAPVDEIDWVEQVEQRQDEAQRYRSGGLDSSFMSLEAEWEQNGHRYLGNHWVAPSVGSGLVEGYKVYHFADSGGGMKGLKRCTLNRTGTSIIGNTAGQTQQQVTTRFEPVESADPPTHYLTAAGCEDVLATFTAQLAAIESQNVAMAVDAERTPEAGVDPAQVEALGQQQLAQVQSSFGFDFAMLEQAAADPAGALPITRKQAKAVQAMIDAGQVERDDLMIVNDAFTAEVAQIAYDDRWAVADGDMKVVMNTLMCNVYGNYPMRIQWHRDGPRKHQFTLENVHLLNVWVDHTHDSIEESDYFIFDWCIDTDRAKSLWPALADTIDSASTTGTLSSEFRRGGIYAKSEFKRKMTVVRTAWLRWQQVPMTVAEATEAGLVEYRDALMGNMPGADMQVVGDAPPLAPELDQDGFTMPVAAPEPVELAPEGWYLVGSDTRLMPPDETTGKASANWPTTIGIMQISYLPDGGKGTEIERMRCPYLDIPFGWNVNIPRPDGSLFGQGEPLRLEDISQQINRLLSILDNHGRTYQFPVRLWPLDLLARIKASKFDFHFRPGADIGIPREDWETVMRHPMGFNATLMTVPPIPSQYVDLLKLLLAEHDRLSGDVQVRQGVAPYAGASGAAIDSLRQESMGPLAFKSKFTEAMVRRIAMIAIDAMVNWMPIEVWCEIVSIPRLVMEDVLARMSRQRFNVRVEIATGKGINRRIDEERAVAMYDKGSPGRLLDRRTALDMVRVPNPTDIQRRIEEEDRKAAGLAAEAAAQSMVDGVQAKGNQDAMNDKANGNNR